MMDKKKCNWATALQKVKPNTKLNELQLSNAT
jgi:hypothetical protein